MLLSLTAWVVMKWKDQLGKSKFVYKCKVNWEIGSKYYKVKIYFLAFFVWIDCKTFMCSGQELQMRHFLDISSLFRDKITELSNY